MKVRVKNDSHEKKLRPSSRLKRIKFLKVIKTRVFVKFMNKIDANEESYARKEVEGGG